MNINHKINHFIIITKNYINSFMKLKSKKKIKKHISSKKNFKIIK